MRAQHQNADTGCKEVVESPVFGDLPKSPGHGPGQPVQRGPQLEQGLDQMGPEAPSHLNHSVKYLERLTMLWHFPHWAHSDKTVHSKGL